jgi:hypothetical protein
MWGALALLAIVGIHFLDELPVAEASATCRHSRLQHGSRARTWRLPSANSIFLKKQRPTRSSGLPKAAIRR